MTQTKPLRNLLIVHTPVKQALSDWLSVKQRIDEQAPDIETRIITNGMADEAVARWQVTRPSLVFSLCPLAGYLPQGGKVLTGKGINKLIQIERMAAHGLPVPPTVRLTRDIAAAPPSWPVHYIVAKPLRGWAGKDVRLVAMRDIANRYDELTLNDRREMIIQPYLEHSENDRPVEYRVLTLFGKVLYSSRNSWVLPRPSLADIAADPQGIIASNNKQFEIARQLCHDAEIITLGERAHIAFPDSPLLGVDILRCMDTGKLYLMEVNAGGETWHLSSGLSKNFDPAHVRDRYAQFGALERTADLLVAKTRAEAA